MGTEVFSAGDTLWIQWEKQKKIAEYIQNQANYMTN